MELRWETLEGWEAAVRDRGRTLVESDHLALIAVDDGQVVRVGVPPLPEWGGWRYGDRLPDRRRRRRGFFRRLLAGLPDPPLEGYDPYGLTGPIGGVGGTRSPSGWLASPFIHRATPLTMAFASVPLAPRCPSCEVPLPLNPWEFQEVTFRRSRDVAHADPLGVGVEACCARCGERVLVTLAQARAALRLGLGILDSDDEARRLGEAAGRGLAQVGGGPRLLAGLGRLGAPLGELDRPERVALAMALDAQAEAEALEEEWQEAEEIAAIMDGELTAVEGFQQFRARILGRG